MELLALADVIELALRAEGLDLDHRWDVAVPRHLVEELHRGCPTLAQFDTYDSLCQAWRDLGIEEHGTPDDGVVDMVQNELRHLRLRDWADERHLAKAVAIGARWFLTLDKDILEKTRIVPSEPGIIDRLIVARPSELCQRMAFDPVFGLQVAEPCDGADEVRLKSLVPRCFWDCTAP
jgi:hypothetical protein